MTVNSPTAVQWATLGTSVLAAAFALFGTLYNSRLERFASEKWWERSAAAYVEIIDVLLQIRDGAVALQTAMGEHKKLSDAHDAGRLDQAGLDHWNASLQQQVGQLNRLHDKVTHAIWRGDLFISDVAVEALTAYQQSLASGPSGTVRTLAGNPPMRSRDPAQLAADLHSAGEAALTAMRREAKADLKVRQRRLPLPRVFP